MKTYKPVWLYFLKIVGLIFCALVASFFVYLLLSSVTFFIKSPMLDQIFKIVVILIFSIAILLIVRGNNPRIRLNSDFFVISGHQFYYAQIKEYTPSKGGSEPYLITKEGNKIDVELSWFKKKDRLEIEKILLEKIKAHKS